MDIGCVYRSSDASSSAAERSANSAGRERGGREPKEGKEGKKPKEGKPKKAPKPALANGNAAGLTMAMTFQDACLPSFLIAPH